MDELMKSVKKAIIELRDAYESVLESYVDARELASVYEKGGEIDNAKLQLDQLIQQIPTEIFIGVGTEYFGMGDWPNAAGWVGEEVSTVEEVGGQFGRGNALVRVSLPALGKKGKAEVVRGEIFL